MIYNKLSPEITERIEEDRRSGVIFPYAAVHAQRRDESRDKASLWRPAFARDTDKILHSALYSRYADKTQVFSFYRNDDVTRRALHVQLVSRIARNIGNVLGLNSDLIEAIALGHDIGHTPFGHAGEKMLSELYFDATGRYFNHNVHSVRVLDDIFPYNISLQTLDGILSHNGEIEMAEYRPARLDGFAHFDRLKEMCYTEKDGSSRLVPSTLEGCIVRISDIIAYIGKDRQDAVKAGLLAQSDFSEGALGSSNSELINNLTVNIIEHSYGKDAIYMDDEHFAALSAAKKENYEKIYLSPAVASVLKETVCPMMEEMFVHLLHDARAHDRDSILYRHHIEFVNAHRGYYSGASYEETTNAEDMAVDFIASMTDDYFIDLYRYLFPDSPRDIRYIGYFGK